MTGIAFAAGSGPVGDYKMKHPDWSFKGAFGQFDRESVQRGIRSTAKFAPPVMA